MEKGSVDSPLSEENLQDLRGKNVSTSTSQHRITSWVYWVPPWCCWDATNPPPLTVWLNVLYAAAGGFTAANLYYSHPILNVLAGDFRTTQSGVSTIPTLAQAGDATGLLLILPLADFFPRRKFTLTLVTLSALFWYETIDRVLSDFDLIMMAGLVSASQAISPFLWPLPTSRLSSPGRPKSCFPSLQSCQLQKHARLTFLSLVLDLRWEFFSLV